LAELARQNKAAIAVAFTATNVQSIVDILSTIDNSNIIFSSLQEAAIVCCAAISVCDIFWEILNPRSTLFIALLSATTVSEKIKRSAFKIISELIEQGKGESSKC
jgi:hypothetical protein